MACPNDGAQVLAGLNTLYGVAFSGERGVEAVEVSADNGVTWQQAEWVGPDLGPNAWRTFQFAANLSVGEHRFVSRATDTEGDRQPKLAIRNHRGYGHNGWQDHALSMRAVVALPKAAIKASSQGSDSGLDTVSAAIPGLALSDKAREGKQLFLQQAQPTCGVCHSLADADARGAVGPNLNQLSPSLAQVESAIAQGVGAMPAYGAQLSQTEIAALATYIVEATR